MQGVVGLGADDGLLAAAQAGDNACFARLIEPHIAAGHRLAASMLNDRAQAEDVVQEAILRAWRGIGRLRSSSRIRPWFLSIVANRSRSLRSTRWWSVVRMPLTDMAQDASTSDTRAYLLSALRRLSPDERAAIWLRFFEDMTIDDVGASLGISATAARSRVHRALRQLRVDLGEEEL